jgi:hypothetical protein
MANSKGDVAIDDVATEKPGGSVPESPGSPRSPTGPQPPHDGRNYWRERCLAAEAREREGRKRHIEDWAAWEAARETERAAARK